jgi:hypothetical protein
MKRAIKVTLAQDTGNSAHLHFFRNLGEDLYHDCEHLGRVNLDEVDSARTHFYIQDPVARARGEFNQLLDRAIAKNGLVGYVEYAWEPMGPN